ncbi:MAG: cytochrome c biogenesis protein CcdA [Nitriliruptorales bacterium]|nr:cytochrome c biogenesis protein CcdA [Nitriliruptorales bacterium]
MGEFAEAFALGNAAILGNVCLLPLYPGLFALLASQSDHNERSVKWMGALVLAGVLVMMIAMGGILHLANRVFADTFPWLLPIAFGLVIVLGVLMIIDRNPLERIGTTEAPILRSPSASAFVYGVALAPMTLPCTGPVILAAFVLGGVAGGTGALVEELSYFLVFGLGFGWPLVLLPFLAGPAQRRFSGFLTRNHRAINVGSGVLLIAVAIIGFVVDFEVV